MNAKTIFFMCFILFFAFGDVAVAHKADSLSVSRLEFVANNGQWESQVLYKAKLNGGALFAETDRITFVFLNGSQLADFYESKFDSKVKAPQFIDAAYYQLKFIKSNPNTKVIGSSPCFHHYNFFYGKNPNGWASHVQAFESIRYQNLYNGIHLLYYQNDRLLKYAFEVEAGADVSQIQLQYDGQERISLVNGNLLVKTAVGQTIELAPFAYQLSPQGDTIPVDCQYLLKKNIVTYKLGFYDEERPLVIDPELIFSSYSGSAADNWGFTATYDNHGNLYGGGIAFGVGYPTPYTPHHYQVDYGGGACDVAISKFDSTGTQLLYATYLGGTSSECPHSLFVNDNDELYVLGTTSSYTFPVTRNAYDTLYNGGSYLIVNTAVVYNNGSDIFISKFSADGDSLLASTFLGGSSNDGLNTGSPLRKNYADESRGEIVIDDQSNVYVVSCTYSDDFPTTAQSFQPLFGQGKEGCVFKFDQNLNHLIWSSYIGASGDDACYSLDVAADKTIFLCGGTTSQDLPVHSQAWQQQFGGGACDGFVAHVSENGDAILQLTYIGKDDYDQSYLLKLSRSGHPYVFGQTACQGSAWMVNALYGQPSGGQFLTHLSPQLDNALWSTAFGTGSGQPDISPTALLVDLCNTVYMSGWGSQQLNGFGGTSGLPVTSDAFQSTTDGSDYYFFCLREDGTSPLYASFFGSSHSREHVDGGTSRFDRKGRIYQAICAGCGGDDNFPTTPGAWSETNGSANCNLGVVKMDFKLPLIIADFDAPSIVCYPDTAFFIQHSQSQSDNYQINWNFGDGTFSAERNPAHVYAHGGTYRAVLTIVDSASCNISDSVARAILVLTGGRQTIEGKAICKGSFTQIGVAPSGEAGVSYLWNPAATLSNPTISNPIASPLQTTTYTLIISTPYCSDTLMQTVEVEDLQISDINDTTICLGESVTLSFVVTAGLPSHVQWSSTPDFSTIIAENVNSITVNPTTETHYFLKVDGDVCSIEREIMVSVSQVNVEPTETQRICFEDSIRLSVQASGGLQLNYLWQPETEVSSGQGTAHIWVHPSASVTYNILITNEYGCSATADIPVIKRVGTFPNPLEAMAEPNHIVEGEITQLTATYYGQNYTYEWTPSTDLADAHSPSTNATPSETRTYTVAVTDEFGCTLSKQVEVEVEPLICGEPLVFIPNTFTPNGDGKNDVLYVRSGILENFVLRIYNRWGELLFETTSLEKGWNGTFKGKYCEQGVYDYYFEGTCLNGDTFQKRGNVTILYN